ncbi:MAG: GH116 family glycosyl-hydrolase, partial [Kiritimatiellae bacterium]|nr:GH116 family glycosyl-hydrolase [Kiritimatiellia bacterium]
MRSNVCFALTMGVLLTHVAVGVCGEGSVARFRPLRNTNGVDYALGSPRIYRDKHLRGVAMPLGGIGTGSIWLDGCGRLSNWLIFNRCRSPRVPNSFFAVRAQARGGTPVVRVLQTVAEGSFPAMASLTYEGGYPIARLDFQDAGLPVEVRMEAFNPMIPLDASNSAIPCAIFRLTARNPGAVPVEVSLVGSLRNAAGGPGGRSRNRVIADRRTTMLAMDKIPDPVQTCTLEVRDGEGCDVVASPLYWFTGIQTLTPEFAAALSRVSETGGVVLADGVTSALFDSIRMVREAQPSAGGTSLVDRVAREWPLPCAEAGTVTPPKETCVGLGKGRLILAPAALPWKEGCERIAA